jgi:hypothetical protein
MAIEQDVKENIWSKPTGSNWKVEKTAEMRSCII